MITPAVNARLAEQRRQERMTEAVSWRRGNEAVAMSQSAIDNPRRSGDWLASALAAVYALVLAFLVDRRVQTAALVVLVVIAGVLLAQEQAAAGLSTSPSGRVR
jgi:hypothetical protein